MLFYEKLIQRRKELSMTQEDLAERLSVSRQTVSKWENGECMPDADKFIRLSDILEISLDELAGREVEVEPLVIPAPEVPQPKKKLSRLLAAGAACLVIGAGCFAAGRYAFPKQAPAPTPAPVETKQTVSVLPETLTVSGFSLLDNTARFVANASVDGTLILYPEYAGGTPIKLPAVYKDGVYQVENLPKGNYQQAVLLLSDGKQERSAPLAENLELRAGGSSWTNID